MKVVLYGYGKFGKRVIEQIKSDGIEIVGIIDNHLEEANGYRLWNADAFIKEKIEVDYVIFVMRYIGETKELVSQILNAGYRLLYVPVHYYWYNKVMKSGAEFIQSDCVPITDEVLSLIEFVIQDGCNLNCKGCSQFSPLVSRDTCVDIDTYTRDIKRLKEVVPHILQIQLLGGEVLLNPDLDLYFKVTRNTFPEARIHILSNGMLIPKMSKKIVRSIKENGIFVYVTPYEPFVKMKSEAELFAQENGICLFTNLKQQEIGVRSKFVKTLFSSKIENQSACVCGDLPSVCRGKYSICSLVTSVRHFNEYFSTHYPEEGAYDLYDPQLSKDEFLRRIKARIPLCEYCVLRADFFYRDEFSYSWEAYGNNVPQKEDWVVNIES